MSDYIVNKDAIRTQIQTFHDLAGDLRTKITNIDNAIDGLVAAVHGTASGNCFDQWSVAREAFDTQANKIDSIAEKLQHDVLDRTDNTDQNLATLKVEAVEDKA